MSRVLITCLVILAPALAQEGARPRVKITAGKPIPPDPPKPELGDKVEVDPSNGDVVVESRGFRRRIVRRVRVQPEFTVQFDKAPGGTVRYAYALSNGAGATQYIQRFTLDVFDRPLTSQQSPPYWWFVGMSSEPKGSLRTAMWGRFARDDDETLRLMPGSTAGPFLIESSGLPGLIKAHVTGHKPAQAEREEEAGLYESMSPWAVNAVLELLKAENDSALVYTVGPKLASNESVFQAVRDELSEASRLAAFADLRGELEQASAWTNRSALREAMLKMGSGRSGVQKAFFEAMAFDLDQAQD